jgi:hypothetical protein
MCHSIKCPGGIMPDPEREPEAYAVYLDTYSGDPKQMERARQTVCERQMNKTYPDLARRVIVRAQRSPVRNSNSQPKSGFLNWLFKGF